jgi:hypothetical protein
MRRIVFCSACHRKRPSPIGDSFDGIDAGARHGTKQMMRIMSGIRYDLCRFQTMGDLNRCHVLKCGGQITEKRQTGQLRAVTVEVLDGPSRIGRMSILNTQGRSDERMSATNTAVQEGNVGRVVDRRESCRSSQRVEPFLLFFNLHNVEEICRNSRGCKRPDTCETADG